MNRLLILEATLCAGFALFVAGCEKKAAARDSDDTGPVAAKVEPAFDSSNFKSTTPSGFRWRQRASAWRRRN